MMNIEFTAFMAELADASYAKFNEFVDDVKLALTTGNSESGGRDFSETQALAFIQAWSIVQDTHQPDTDTGFSATLFQGLSGANELAGEYVLAIRGTEHSNSGSGLEFCGNQKGQCRLIF